MDHLPAGETKSTARKLSINPPDASTPVDESSSGGEGGRRGEAASPPGLGSGDSGTRLVVELGWGREGEESAVGHRPEQS